MSATEHRRTRVPGTIDTKARGALPAPGAAFLQDSGFPTGFEGLVILLEETAIDKPT